MSRNLESRIAKLEAVNPKEPELSILVWGDHGGRLTGYAVGGRYAPEVVSRKPGESDAELQRRAIEADGRGRQPGDPVRFLCEQRA